MNAHKQGKTQAIKGRDYFNPFSQVTQQSKFADFERGYTEGQEERKAWSVESTLKDAVSDIPKKKWWQFWKWLQFK